MAKEIWTTLRDHMDKRQFSAVITDVYRSLEPSKVSIFIKNDDTKIVRVISESFSGMTYSSRAKLLNDELQRQQPDIFNEGIYIFEAFTTAENEKLTIDNNLATSGIISGEFSESAKELE